MMIGIRQLGYLSATILLLFASQSQLNAKSKIVEVKPDGANVGGFKFKIVSEKDLGRDIKFRASIIEAGAKLSRSPNISLGTVDADGHTKSIVTKQTPLKATRWKEGLGITFTLPKSSIKDRRYCLILKRFEEREVDGKIVPMPSADIFVMRIHDFVQYECELQAARPKIIFENRPEMGVPREALRHVIVDGKSHGTLENVAGDSIESIAVRYHDKNWSSNKQLSEYLVGLLTDKQTECYTHQIWSDPVGEPEIECLVKFKGIGQGRLLVWHAVACFRDVKGKWWFATLYEHYHRNHPAAQKDLISDPAAKE